MHGFSAASTTLIISMVVIYIALTTWLTIRLRSKSNSDFMQGSKSLPAIIVGLMLMSEFIGAQSTVGTAQSAFEHGIAASWSILGAAIGYPLFGLILVKRIYKTGQVTISGAISQKYGRSTKNLVSLIMIYALLLVNTGNYVSGAAAIASVLHVSLITAAFITAIVSTFYFGFGGMKGVAYVTIVHTAVKYFAVMAIVWVALKMTGGFTPMFHNMPKFYWSWDGTIGIGTIGAWVIGTIGTIFCTQYIIQAISSTKSANSARRSTFLACIFCIPIALGIALAGVAAKYLHPEMSSLFALPSFLNEMSPWLAAVVTTGLVASVFVSVSTVALAISSLVIKDFYIPYCNPTEKQQFRMTRILSLIIGFAPLLLVFFVPEILKLSFFTRALRLSISVVAIVAFFAPFYSSTRGANCGLLGSAILTSVWYLAGNPFGINNMYVALAAPAIIMLIDALLPHKKAVQQTNADSLAVSSANPSEPTNQK